MISKKDFTQLIEYIKSNDDYVDKLHDLNIDIIETLSQKNFNNVISLFFKQFFNDEGIDFIYWWLYDNVDKYIYDDNDNIIADLTKIEDFYNYLIVNKECFIKNV